MTLSTIFEKTVQDKLIKTVSLPKLRDRSSPVVKIGISLKIAKYKFIEYLFRTQSMYRVFNKYTNFQ